MRTISCVAVLMALAVLTTCARDKTPPGEPTELQPAEIEISFTTEADFTSDYYYFFVFNFTNSPNTDEEYRPEHLVSGPDRGARWERYIMFNGETRTAAYVKTLTKTDEAAFTSVGTGPVALVSGDVNGDELPDIVTANSIANTVSVLLLGATGRFAGHVDYEVGDGPVALALFEFTGDEQPDIIVSNNADSAEGNSLSILRNDGAGDFSLLTTVELTAQPHGLAVGEFTGDEADDLAVALFTDSEEGNRIAVFPMEETGFGEPVYTDVGVNPTAIEVTDLNGDTLADLAVLNSFNGEGGNSMMLLQAAGDGSFTIEHTFETDPEPTGLAVARLNADEFDDYALTSAYNDELGNTLAVILSDGEGGFHVPDLQAVGHAPTDVLAGDLNEDGLTDLVVVESADDTEGNRIRRLLQNEFGGFGSAQVFSVGKVPYAGVLVDLDSDTHLDCIVVNSADDPLGNSIALLKGNGEGDLQGVIAYWTDEEPEDITNQVWYLSVSILRNRFTILLDPVMFRDLNGEVPDNFIVDFMIFDTGIDMYSNPNDYGLEWDWLHIPLIVDAEVGFEAYEEQDELENPYEDVTNPPPPANIVDWYAEVR